MKILIINKESKQIESNYEAQSPDQSKFGGPWGNSELYAHLELPENVQFEAAECDENYNISENASKKADYINEQRFSKLNELRSQRDEKLKRVDQLINIAFLNSWTAAEKTELKDYRQALLDITEPYKANMSSLCDDLDLNNFVWPTEPSES